MQRIMMGAVMATVVVLVGRQSAFAQNGIPGHGARPSLKALPNLPNKGNISLPHVGGGVAARPNLPNVPVPKPIQRPNINLPQQKPNIPLPQQRPNLPLPQQKPNISNLPSLKPGVVPQPRPQPPTTSPRPGTLPSLPNINRPELKPGIPNPGGTRPSLPNINLPNINRPGFGGSGGTTGSKPSLPNINFPNINRPELKPGVPNPGGTKPSLPNINLPNITLPNINRPGFGGSGGTTGTKPTLPNITLPNINRPGFGGSGGSSNFNPRPEWTINNSITNNNINNNININNTNFYRPGYNRPWWGYGGSAWYGNGYWGGYYTGWHTNWHNGYWNGFWNNAAWFGSGLATGWLLAPTIASYNYVNPFYIAPSTLSPTTSYYDYSTPIVVVSPPTQAAAPTDVPVPVRVNAATEAAASPPPVVKGVDVTQLSEEEAAKLQQTVEARMLAARDAFRQGDYATARTQVDEAISLLPSDPALHEFRALVLFAQRDYQPAAATIYSVLASGPGWNWETLRSFYPSTDDYTKQLRELEAYFQANPTAGHAAFLLAYHYLCIGNKDAAIRMLKKELEIVKTDELAKRMLEFLQNPPPEGGEPPRPQPGN